MPRYVRARQAGGTYFFTVATAGRAPVLLRDEVRLALREAVIETRARWPFVGQPRFWEHLIRDAQDYARHLDYIHFNPVKHGLVTRAREWPYSTFHRYLKRGLYDADWYDLAPNLNLE